MNTHVPDAFQLGQLVRRVRFLHAGKSSPVLFGDPFTLARPQNKSIDSPENTAPMPRFMCLWANIHARFWTRRINQIREASHKGYWAGR